MGVFDLEKLAQFVTSRMGPLLVEHQRCSRTRSPLSKCSHCTDICPVNALSFGAEGIEIADNCLECGLCAGVCPTGALGIQEPTQLALLEKIRSLSTQGVTISIGCRRQPELNPKGLSVPCRFFYSNFRNRNPETLASKGLKGLFFLLFLPFYV